jgi:hypothetical protein
MLRVSSGILIGLIQLESSERYGVDVFWGLFFSFLFSSHRHGKGQGDLSEN